MSYQREATVQMGSANTDPTQCSAEFQTHGAINASGNPSPTVTVVNDGTHFYFKHLGSGVFMFTYDLFPDGFRGALVFKYAGAVKGSIGINPEEIENVDIKVSGIAASVWAQTTRTLTSLGSLVTAVAAAVWTYASRSLTLNVQSSPSSGATITPAVLDWEVPIGTTVDFDVVVPDVDGVAQVVTNWDIYCTAKDRFSTLDGGTGQLFQLTVGSGITKDPLGTGELNKFRVTIGPALTKNLPFSEKQYELDIKVALPGSPKDPRLIGKGVLNVTPTVTRAGTP